MTGAAAAPEATTLGEGPVQGPAAPAYSDLIWATGTTAAPVTASRRLARSIPARAGWSRIVW